MKGPSIVTILPFPWSYECASHRARNSDADVDQWFDDLSIAVTGREPILQDHGEFHPTADLE